MDKFSDEIEYVLRYLGFLMSVNDENSKCFVLLFLLMHDNEYV
jgi:hypothetical protein